MAGRAVIRRVAATVAASAAALAFAGEAWACVCERAPLDERLDRSDAAVVGRIVAEREVTVRGLPQRLLTVEVDQRVKGDVSRELLVRSPSQSDCDLVAPENKTVGLLLTRSADGVWLGSLCSVVDAGRLVAAGGAPRGGFIKVVIGLAILGIVLSWALRRRARGTRPRLPGAPGP